MTTRKRLLSGLAIVALFVLAAWLFSVGDSTPAPAEHAVTFPQAPVAEPSSPHSQAQSAARTDSHPIPQTQSPRKRDPLLVALPNGSNGLAVVLEANALRNSRIGELFLDCLQLSDAGVLERMRDETGIDPLKDLDRLALSHEGILMTGQFAGVRWDNLLDGRSPTPYGDQGNLYDLAADGGAFTAATRWGNQLFSLNWGESAREMVDRLEGRAPDETPLISDAQAYGDAYGVIGPSDMQALLGKLLPADQAPLRDRLVSAASSIEFHLDASSDLALTAEVQGSDPSALSDLARSLGAAFSLWRVYAHSNGPPELAALLDQAEVKPGDGRFEVRLALPLAVVQERFANCHDWNWGSKAGSK